MAALWNRAGHYIFVLCFLLSFYLFSSTILSLRRLDVYHTSTHGVALQCMRIQDAGLKRAARGSLKIQDAKKAQKSPSAHHRTNQSGYIFATKARIDNRKNMLNSSISSTCSCNMVNLAYQRLRSVLVWGTQLISTGFESWQRYCTAPQQWASANLCGVEQRARLRLYSAGRPSRWALAHMPVTTNFTLNSDRKFYNYYKHVHVVHDDMIYKLRRIRWQIFAL